MFHLIALLFLAIIILKFAFERFVLYKKLRHFKCPPQHFLLGHVKDLVNPKVLLENLDGYTRRYGSLFRLNATILRPIIVVSDLAVLAELLQSSKAIGKADLIYGPLRKTIGDGLVNSKGKKWLEMRKLVTPCFHFQILEQFVEVFNSASDAVLKKLQLQVGKPFDIHTILPRFSLDIMCETSMGISARNSEVIERYDKNVEVLMSTLAERVFNPWKLVDALFYFTPDYRRLKKSKDVSLETSLKVIEERGRNFVKGGAVYDDVGRKKRWTLLDRLLQGRQNGQPLSYEEIVDEVTVFLGAGHETVSLTLSMICHYLSIHQDVQELVVQEILTIFGNVEENTLNINNLSKMHYTETVIKETMRMHPVVGVIGRQLDEDHCFNGVSFPAGVPILIPIQSLHNNPEYFPNPEVFDPERFNSENITKIHPASYIPFSMGPRNCIGHRFAMLELKVAIAKILSKYKILDVPEKPFEVTYQLTTKPARGVWVKLEARSTM